MEVNAVTNKLLPIFHLHQLKDMVLASSAGPSRKLWVVVVL
jgi:hypothetical protein